MEPLYVQESIKFISEENISISLDDNVEIVVNLLNASASSKCSHDAIKLIVAYFREDLEYLHKTTGESFQALKKRIQPLVYGDGKESLEIQRKITNYKMRLFQDPRIRLLCSTELSKYGLDSTNDKTIRAFCEISPPPKNRKELLENVRLDMSNPRYVLSDSLAVFDCMYGNIPPQWSKLAVFKELKRQIGLEIKIGDDKTEANLSVLRKALAAYKHVNAVPMSIIVHLEETPENGAMKIDLITSLKENLPTFTTKHLFYDALKDNRFGELLKQVIPLGKFSIYIQKEGSLVVVLPSSHSLADAGINPLEFDKFEKPLHENYFKPMEKGVFDLSKVFMKETEDQILRLIPFWTGHGLNSTQNKDDGHIVGMPIPLFKKNWEILSEMTDFLLLDSCFLGGNMNHIDLPSGMVTCPIIIKSSTDLTSYTTLGLTMHLALKMAVLKLYPNGEGKNQKPKQLIKKDLKEIGSLAFGENFYKDNGKLMNMQSFLLPTCHADIPHAAYLGFISPQVMDTDEELKHLRKLGLNENVVITDQSKKREIYFFSQPVLPVTLINERVDSSAIGLASRGGNNFHILNGLELPGVEFKTILDKTLANRSYDATGVRFHKEKGASKLFVMGKLRCQVNKRNILLENVVIAATDKGPFVACKTPDNGYTGYYILNSREALDKMDFSEVTEDEFYQLFYPLALTCAPSVEQLKINTAGRQGANDFFGAFQKLFFHENITPATELLDAIVQKGSSDLEVINIRNKIHEEYRTKVKRHKVLISGIVLAIQCHNLSALKDLANSIDLNVKDSKGVPLLQHAILMENPEIIQFLLKGGADPYQKNKENISGYELASNNISIFKLLIEGRKIEEWNRPFCLGVSPICHAMATSNEPLLKFLIEKKLHLLTKFEGFPLIGLPISAGNIKFVKLLIANGLNLDVKHNGNHLIFLAIHQGNLENIQLFVDTCASLNVKDKNGLSPIQLADKLGKMEIKNILLKKTRHNGSVKLDEKLMSRLPAESKGIRSNFVFVAKDYQNFLSLINENDIKPTVSIEIENKLLQVLKLKQDLTDLVELVESGYMFSKEFYQKILHEVIMAPNFKSALFILDQGVVLSQQQCNQWILKLIKLGRSDLIKGLGERGYTLQNMNTTQNEILELILCNQKQNELILSLITAAAAGLDLRRLSEDSRKRIAMTIEDILKDQPKVLNMFDKLLHLERKCS